MNQNDGISLMESNGGETLSITWKCLGLMQPVMNCYACCTQWLGSCTCKYLFQHGHIQLNQIKVLQHPVAILKWWGKNHHPCKQTATYVKIITLYCMMPQAKIFTYMYAQTVQVFSMTTILLCSLVPKRWKAGWGLGTRLIIMWVPHFWR